VFSSTLDISKNPIDKALFIVVYLFYYINKIYFILSIYHQNKMYQPDK